MSRVKPAIKVDGASLIIYPTLKSVYFKSGPRDLVEFAVNTRSIRLAASLDPSDTLELRETQMRTGIADCIDQRITALQALKTQVLLGTVNLLDTEEDT